MTGSSSARDILKELLQGNVAPRPLFVPIVFRLGTRVENLPLRAFLANPTKISNSVRQIRTRLQADAVSCYFDPFVEAEALGATLDWPSEQGPPVLCWPEPTAIDQIPVLDSRDEIINRGRITVALEVIRRLKTLLREDCLLMAGVSGPSTLAARLSGLQPSGPLAARGVTSSAIAVAASAITQVSKAFAEAGANLVFFREDSLWLEGAGGVEGWISLLTPIFNILRFYEVLPVLQIADERIFKTNAMAIVQGIQGCVVCATPDALADLLTQPDVIPESTAVGISLPSNAFREEQTSSAETSSFLTRLVAELRPALVTTAEDVPATTDLRHLAAVSALIRG